MTTLERVCPVQPAATPPTGAPATLELRLLGGLGVLVDGAPVAVTNRKARGLLAFLALEAPTGVSRERAAGLLWGEVGEAQARNSLRQALFELKIALSRHRCNALATGREALSLLPGAFSLDTDRIVEAIAAAPEPLPALRPGDTLLLGYEDLSPAFRDWLAVARHAVQARLLNALERLFLDEALARKRRRLAAEAALGLDPLNEGACRVAMRLAAEDGELGAALRCYASLYEVMGAELDMEPSDLTQKLVAEIKQGEVAAPPPPPPPPPRPAPAVPAAARERRCPLVPDGTPTLAVLPFQAVGPDALPEYLAHGIVEDIVAVLASLHEPAVISANSSRRLTAAQAADVMGAGRALGADYVVSGTIRAGGGRARLAVELSESSQGAVLWARAFEVEEAELFSAQGAIAAGVAGAITPRVGAAELRASHRAPPDDLGAYHLLLQARDRMFLLDRDALEEAGTLLRRAAAIDPDYAPIHAAMINWHALRIFQGWSPDRGRDERELEQAARTALRLDPGHARALALWGHNRTIIAQDYDEALDLLDRAVEAAPNDAETLCWTVPTLAYVERAEEAVQRGCRALALSPQDPFLFRYEHFLSIAYYVAGDFGAAVQWGMRSATRNPNYTSNLRVTAAALAAAGRARDAAPLVDRLMSLQPGLRVSLSMPRYAFRDPARRERYASHLIQAGVPG